MGVDKKNIRTVIHLAPPSSPEAYLQESGRASRDGLGARAWLIWTPGDLGAEVLAGTAGAEENGERALRESRGRLMQNYILSGGNCRRSVLLSSLGVEAEDCPGCDVCGGEAWERPPEEGLILGVVRRNSGRFGRGLMARLLIGRSTAEIRRSGQETVRGFGGLAGWELEDAEEALEMLLRCGKLRVKGLWRRDGRLRVKRQGGFGFGRKGLICGKEGK